MPASSYQSLVTLVTDIMNSIADMYRCPLIEVSDEMINAWESKIGLAEKLEFNVSWLRSRFDDVKKDFNDGRIQKLKMEAEQDDTNSQSPKVKVKNESDETRESLPGFMFEGML
ncbi:hypothetical protein MKW92_048053 [Papaver armeniacum]|nr:hypothetical protein MKW92_048053 [Papaver armeniacum]